MADIGHASLLTAGLLLLLLQLVIASDDYCLCGIEGVSQMIHNGQRTREGQYPWVVFIGYMILGRRGHHRLTACAGSIINDRYILTSAHCLTPPPAQEVNAYAGLELGVWIGDKIDPDKLQLADAIQVKGWELHENYSSDGSIDVFTDVALVELQEPLKFDLSFMPICLPDFNDYDNLFAAGWGLIGNPEVEPEGLMEVELTVVPDDVCKLIYEELSDHEMCAGDADRNVCPGDSGGPLMTRKWGIVYQAGITAAGTTTTGDDCGLTPNPAIFEKVSSHLDWIREKSGPDAKWCQAPYQAIGNEHAEKEFE